MREVKRAVLILLAVISVQAEDFKTNIDLLTSEGVEGWMGKVNEKGKTNGQKRNEGLSRETRTTTDPYTSEKLSPQMQALDLAVTNDFRPNAAVRPKRWLDNLREDWDSKSFNERQARATALISAVNNIPKLANAKEDPVGAVQGALNIIASVAQVAGPSGQLVSVAFMFASSMLNLLGKGNGPNKMKPIGEIVRDQIDEALSEYQDQQISDEAETAIFAFRISKAYVDGAGRNRDKISDNDVGPLATNVPVLSGLRVMGLLATQIVNVKTANNPGDAKKCFKYVELYCQLATLRSMIMSQVIGLIPDTFPGTIDGYANAREVLKDATKSMLEFLYEPSEGSKLMPYFDGEIYLFANNYLKTALNILRPNHFPGSGYCITAFGQGSNYLGKYFKSGVFPRMSHPLAEVSNTEYCKWRLVPHGNNIFSIISEDGMLSYDNKEVPVVSIERYDPALWELRSAGGSNYWIKIKYFCEIGNRCNHGLRYKLYNYYYLQGGSAIGSINTIIEQPITVAYLHAVSNSMYPWSIYKRPSDMPSTADDVNGNEQSDMKECDESWAKPGDNSETRNASEPIIKINRTETNQMSNRQPVNSEKFLYDQRQNDGDDEILTKEGEEGWLEKLLQKAKSKSESSKESASPPPKKETRKTAIHKKKHGHKKE